MWHAKTYKLEPLKVEFEDTQLGIIFLKRIESNVFSCGFFKKFQTPKITKGIVSETKLTNLYVRMWYKRL
jgi:hypothetical protein